MNKFVKGAKNLAFALSFVTVAACGGVKKGDLDALEKKINGELSKKADTTNCVAKNDIKDFVKGDDVTKQINGEVDKVKKEVVNLDVLKRSFDNDWVAFTQIFGFVPGIGGDKKMEKCELEFAFEDGGKAKFKVLDGDKVEIVKEENKERVLGCKDFMLIEGFMKMGGEVKLEGLVFDNETTTDNNVKFATKKFDLAKKDEFDFLKFLVGICVANEKGFKDLGLDKIVVDSSKFSGKDLKACKNHIDDFIALFNSVEKECCVKEGKNVKFVKGKGWTSNGNDAIAEDVLVPFDN